MFPGGNISEVIRMMPDREAHSTHLPREHERRTVTVEAQIRDHAEWHECRIVNISAGGAKLRSECRFEAGAEVQLNIGQWGQFSGTVVWQHSEELGVKFTHDPAEIADVIMGLAMYG